MNYRTVELMANQAFPVAGTHIFPVRVKDPITALYFSFQITVGAAQRINHFLEAFPTIRIVDGSEVLLNLSGGQMDGVLCYESPKDNVNFYTNMPTVLETMRTGVLFGRYRGDEQLAFDPKRFDNPMIEITYNGALISANAIAPTNIQVFAEVFDEKVPSPIGFLENQEFHRWTPVTNAMYYIDLPTDQVIRKLFVQPWDPGVTSNNTIQATRLDEDNLKRVIFDLTTTHWSTLERLWFGSIFSDFYMTRTGAAALLFCAPTLGEIPWAQSIAGITATQILGAIGGQITMNQANNALWVYGRVHGTSPYQLLCYPMGKQDVIEDWYDPKDVGELRLRVQGGAAVVAGGQGRVILQQLRRY